MTEKAEVGEIAISKSPRAGEKSNSGCSGTSDPEMWRTMSRLPSFSVGSYKSVSPEPSPEDEQQKWWKSISKSVVK